MMMSCCSTCDDYSVTSGATCTWRPWDSIQFHVDVTALCINRIMHYQLQSISFRSIPYSTIIIIIIIALTPLSYSNDNKSLTCCGILLVGLPLTLSIAQIETTPCAKITSSFSFPNVATTSC